MQATRELIAVKFGTESIVNGTGIDIDRINDHAERLAPVHEENDLVIITSGAVAWAQRRLRAMGRDPEDYSRRTRAMLGTAGITVAWEQAFERVGIVAGQVLLTNLEMTDAKEGPRLLDAYGEARKQQVVPVCNYKDFLSLASDSHDELRKIDVYQDNDRFGRELAGILGASTLIMATDGVDGYLEGGEVVHQFHAGRLAELQGRTHEPSEEGMGGILSKLENSVLAVEAGMRAFICNADADFAGMLDGELIGTEVIQYA
jgi:glutamate 5-kinase